MSTTPTPLIRRLWTAPEIVKAIDTISLPRLYELARTGKIPVVRFGRALRFDPDAVAAWIAAGGTASEDQ